MYLGLDLFYILLLSYQLYKLPLVIFLLFMLMSGLFWTFCYQVDFFFGPTYSFSCQ